MKQLKNVAYAIGTSLLLSLIYWGFGLESRLKTLELNERWYHGERK